MLPVKIKTTVKTQFNKYSTSLLFNFRRVKINLGTSLIAAFLMRFGLNSSKLLLILTTNSERISTGLYWSILSFHTSYLRKYFWGLVVQILVIFKKNFQIWGLMYWWRREIIRQNVDICEIYIEKNNFPFKLHKTFAWTQLFCKPNAKFNKWNLANYGTLTRKCFP